VFEFLTLQFGSLVCINWNGAEDETPVGNIALSNWACTGFEIDEWIDDCMAGGMRYMMLPVMTEQGINYWDTAFHTAGNAPYCITQTDWYANGGYDLVDVFLKKCRAKGMFPFLYYSIYNRTVEIQTGKTPITDAAYFTAMYVTQLTEIMTNYGEVKCIWIDGYWKYHGGEINAATLVSTIKNIQPNCIVIFNHAVLYSLPSDINTYEQPGDGYPLAANTSPGEVIETIRLDSKWQWHTGGAQDNSASAFFTSAQLKTNILTSNYACCNYVTTITPMTDGHLPAVQRTILQNVGLL
jgi:alpha-L-fucosidase